MFFLNTLPNSFILGEKDDNGNIIKQLGFPKGGLTYLIENNNIKFYLTPDYMYRNVVFSADAPFLINGIPVSVDNLPSALKNIFKVEQEAVDVDTEFDDQSFNPIANAPVAIRFNDVDSTIDSLSGEVQTKADIEDIPTNVSELVNDAGYITEESISGDYATKVWVQDQGYLTEHQDISGKQDVSGMTAYTTNDVFSTHTGNTDIHVTANEKETWNNKSDFSGSYNDLTDKPTIPVVPTNVSDFVNDAGYVTQANIDAAVSGKADTSDVQEIASDVATVSGDVNTLSGSVESLTGAVNTLTGDVSTLSGQVQTNETTLTAHTANTDIHVTASDKQNWNNKSDFSGDYNDLTNKPTIPTVPTNVSDFVNDAGYATSGYVDSSVSGKVNTTDFNTYSASTDARISEDEEVTSAALNELNDALDGKADTSAVTAAISAATNDMATQTWVSQQSYMGYGEFDNFYNTDYLPFTTATTENLNELNEAISGKADTSAVTEAVSGKMDTSTFNTYSANTDARIAEDEEVTAAGLNSLNSNKQDKLTAGENITINGNVISAAGGNNVIELTQAQYDALTDIDPDAFYIITDADGGVTTGQVQTMINTAIATKQDTLVSGTNIKTINNESLLGSGNIDIQGGSSINVVQATGTSTGDVMSQNAVTSSINKKLNSVDFTGTNWAGTGTTSLRKTIDGSVYTTYAFVASINQKPILSSDYQNVNKFSLVETSAFTAHTADTTIHTTSAEKASWNGAATNASNAITALGGLKLVSLTQAQYDALATKDASTLYLIVN